MLHDLDEEARMKRILEVLDRNLQLGLKINEVVGRLSEKRVTLEEKMIRSYFHQVGANMLELSACLNRALALATTPKGGGQNLTDSNVPLAVTILSTDQIKQSAEKLDHFFEGIEPELDKLLKALRYDLNYVEQYFEFNYYNKLTNEDSFLTDSAQLLKNFKDSVR